MRPLNALFLLFGTIVVLIGGIAYYNVHTDPQCFYSCPEIDPKRPTLNAYYEVAKTIVAHPDAEQIILGSSRGQTTPPLWVQDMTGMKTLNLSSQGAEFVTKLAFVNIAEEKTRLKRVIWLADYFELISENADPKIKNTPALRKYLEGNNAAVVSGSFVDTFKTLIDHNTTEASIEFKKRGGLPAESQGAASHMDAKACASSEFKGLVGNDVLKREVEMLYQNYTQRVLVSPQNPQLLENFATKMKSLAAKGIDILIVVTPYHPDFLLKMKAEFPEIYQRHLDWIQKLKTLDGERIRVVDSLASIPGGDSSPAYWNDGVHFTCKGAMSLLGPLLK
ncbi:hypothetical protein ACLSU7_03420 [Bdellovibrio sp. HCB185ZH]|uniref:hypothetical protein n=1 Tax=Bdellovibrio sp. HCB185ZH TaxID=3394235 RepID=UPI0039A4FCE2